MYQDPLVEYGQLPKKQLAKIRAEKLRDLKKAMKANDRWAPDYDADLATLPMSQIDLLLDWYSSPIPDGFTMTARPDAGAVNPAADRRSSRLGSPEPTASRGIEHRGFRRFR